MSITHPELGQATPKPFTNPEEIMSDTDVVDATHAAEFPSSEGDYGVTFTSAGTYISTEPTPIDDTQRIPAVTAPVKESAHETKTAVPKAVEAPLLAQTALHEVVDQPKKGRGKAVAWTTAGVVAIGAGIGIFNAVTGEPKEAQQTPALTPIEQVSQVPADQSGINVTENTISLSTSANVPPLVASVEQTNSTNAATNANEVDSTGEWKPALNETSNPEEALDIYFDIQTDITNNSYGRDYDELLKYFLDANAMNAVIPQNGMTRASYWKALMEDYNRATPLDNKGYQHHDLTFEFEKYDTAQTFTNTNGETVYQWNGLLTLKDVPPYRDTGGVPSEPNIVDQAETSILLVQKEVVFADGSSHTIWVSTEK